MCPSQTGLLVGQVPARRRQAKAARLLPSLTGNDWYEICWRVQAVVVSARSAASVRAGPHQASAAARRSAALPALSSSSGCSSPLPDAPLNRLTSLG